MANKFFRLAFFLRGMPTTQAKFAVKLGLFQRIFLSCVKERGTDHRIQGLKPMALDTTCWIQFSDINHQSIAPFVSF